MNPKVAVITVDGPSQDLHSVSFGGAVMNPAIALCHLLSSLVDGEGRIQIPGYYDDVRELAESERKQWQQLNQNDDEFAQAVGVDQLFGEAGFTAIQAIGGVIGNGGPSLIINGGNWNPADPFIVLSPQTVNLNFGDPVDQNVCLTHEALMSCAGTEKQEFKRGNDIFCP